MDEMTTEELNKWADEEFARIEAEEDARRVCMSERA